MRFCLYALSIFFFFSCSPRDIGENTNKKITPKVVNIYPTADTLPENLLRLYVQFSHSMKAVNNLEHIKLIDEKGEEVKGAIFNNVYELWDAEQKQLTLILDPSRVKTGLVANENLGRALEPNKHFKLVIERAEDIYGNLLEVPYSKEICVIREDKEIPNIKNWEIITPKANSASSLKINFPQILDRLSLYHKIRLLAENGKVVFGKIEISNQEKTWQLFPEKKWERGLYTLEVSSRLEDPCGNNINGLFDHKLGSLKNEYEGEILKVEIEIGEF